MGTIAQELARIQNAKASLKTSIENKGVQVPANTLIDGYPALVDQIPQGGGGNPFDDSEFTYLCYNGRFVTYGDYTDLIKTSVRNNISEWGFSYYARSVRGTLTQIQNLLDAAAANANCGNATSIIFQYAFQMTSVQASSGTLTFKPIANRNAQANLGSIFSGFNDNGAFTVDLIIDYSDFNTGNFSDSSAYYSTTGKCNYYIKGYPISKRTSALTLSNSGYSHILEFTVRGSSRYGINLAGLTNMSIDNYIAFFNSISATTYSSVTITIPTSIYNQLTADQKAIITDKNYLLASA